jgi:hypothetical protein
MKLLTSLKKEWVKTYEAPRNKTEVIRFSLPKARHNNQDIIPLKTIKRKNISKIKRMTEIKKKDPDIITIKEL